MTGIPFPDIDPVALALGPLQIRWYALAYLAGILGGMFYAGWLADLDKGSGRRPTREDTDNIVPWIVLGIILGGRVGYILFYNFGFFLENPLSMFKVWEGGMSFHGGLLGVAIAIISFCRYHKIPVLAMGDIISTVVPIGLFFGRLANFVNGELFGRVTDAAWGMVFPHGGELPRHPSQLYEAFLEGIVLFIVLFLMARKPSIRQRHGMLFGTLLVGYGLSRFLVEYVREPDPQLGFFFDYFSMGQLLCLPMILVGGFLISHARKKEPQVSA